MFHHRFSGSVLVNGSPRQVNIEGNPMGRTVIKVDGATVYDKKPFIQKETFEFNLVPGKPATMRWHQISPLKMECDITVDQLTTTLSTLAKDGTLRQPVGAKARQIAQIRWSGVGVLVLAGISFWLNYSEVSTKGEYYPKYLAAIPILTLMGIVAAVRPDFDISAKNKAAVWTVVAIGGVALIFGFTIFTQWFLAAFGTH